jgi:hypothetical protein
MTDPMTLTQPRRAHPGATVNLDNNEMAVTLAEWHRSRDTDDVCVVVPHEPRVGLAA